MFNKILLFLCFILPTTVFGQEFSPHLKLSFNNGVETRFFSGTVIEADKNQIVVVTCWHGTMGFARPSKVGGYLVTDHTDNHLSAKVTFDVIKTYPDHDIMLLGATNVLGLKIKTIPLAKDSLSPGAKCVSYGYVGIDSYIDRKSVV